MKVLGISIITNVNDPDHPVPATVEEIIAVARRAAPGPRNSSCAVSSGTGSHDDLTG